MVETDTPERAVEIAWARREAKRSWGGSGPPDSVLDTLGAMVVEGKIGHRDRVMAEE